MILIVSNNQETNDASRSEQGDASGNNEHGENDTRQSDESSQERQDNQDPAGSHMRVSK